MKTRTFGTFKPLTSAQTQHEICNREAHHIAEACKLFSDLVKGGLTRGELEALISRRPALWSKYSAWLDKLPA